MPTSWRNKHFGLEGRDGGDRLQHPHSTGMQREASAAVRRNRLLSTLKGLNHLGKCDDLSLQVQSTPGREDIQSAVSPSDLLSTGGCPFIGSNIIKSRSVKYDFAPIRERWWRGYEFLKKRSYVCCVRLQSPQNFWGTKKMLFQPLPSRGWIRTESEKKKNQTIKGTHRGCHGSYNDGKWQDHHKPRISSKKASTSTSRPFNCGTGSVGGAQN